MGKLIVFWSPWHGQARVTASMGATAIMMQELTGEKVIMTHTQFGMADLEGCFDARRSDTKRRMLYDGAGLQALILNFKQNKLTKEQVERCAMPMLQEGLYLLPGVEQSQDLTADEDMEKILETILIRAVVPTYDWTFVDLASGGNRLSRRLMEQADLVVVALSQNTATWSAFLKEWGSLAAKTNIFYVLGGYKKESKYTIKRFQRMFHAYTASNRCGIIPDCTDYMDALSEGQAGAFFLMNRQVKKRERNFEFMQECKETVQKLLQCVKEDSLLWKGG